MKRQRSSSFSNAPRKRARLSAAQTRLVTNAIKARSDKRQVTYNGNTAIGTTGNLVNLMSNMTRGDQAKNNFAGEFIDWRYIRLRTMYRVAAADSVDTIRTILFQWDDSVPPVIGNVLDLANGVEPVLAPKNWGTRRICRILIDETQTVVSTASNDHVTTHNFVPARRLSKTWFGTSPSVPVKNGLWCLQVSDSVVVPNPVCEIAFEGCFTDDI